MRPLEKLRPYLDPYRVLNLTPTNAEVRLIEKPDDPSIFVLLDRVRPCYSELPNRSWSGHTSKRKRKRKQTVKEPSRTRSINRSRAKATILMIISVGMSVQEL